MLDWQARERVAGEAEVTVEIGPASERQQLRSGAIQQGAVGVATQHHFHTQPSGQAGHEQSLLEATAFEQLDVDSCDMGDQALHIGHIPAAFIGDQRNGGGLAEFFEANPITLRIRIRGQGLLDARGADPASVPPSPRIRLGGTQGTQHGFEGLR